jgi:ribonuclease HI
MIYVYTDGACMNNGHKNAVAGIGIYFGENDQRNVSEKIDGKQSNNTAELSAIIRTYEILKNDIETGKEVTIVSDSVYAIRCAGEYGLKNANCNWVKDIPNKELVREIYELYRAKSNVNFMHIKAHTANRDIHSIGNEHADRLANMAIGVSECPYDTKSRIYLNVPFAEKEHAKTCGAKWDPKKKKWWVTNLKPELKIYA